MTDMTNSQDIVTKAEAAAAKGRDALAAWWNAATREQRLQVIDGARHLLAPLFVTPIPTPPAARAVSSTDAGDRDNG